MPTGKFIRTKKYREKMSKIPTIGFYPNNHNWTKKEKEILKNYSDFTKQELLKLLPDRKYQSIIQQAFRQGLKKSKEIIRKQISLNHKGLKWNKNSKEKQKLLIKNFWQNPKYRENMIKKHTGKKQREETIKKRVEKIKGENHYNWREGISNQGYPNEWTDDLKESIRKRDDYICQMCGIHQDELEDLRNKKLDCHHIDYDKDNLNPNNLISLCRNCHMKTNQNRKYWINYFLSQA